MITRANIVDFSLKRPDILDISLSTRIADTDTFNAAVDWKGYRNHIDTAVTGDYAAYPSRETQWTFINQGQAIFPGLQDKFTVEGDTWLIIDAKDLNVLKGTIAVTARKIA